MYVYNTLVVCLHPSMYIYAFGNRFVTPKDTWPKMDKAGLTMELAESKDRLVTCNTCV